MKREKMIPTRIKIKRTPILKKKSSFEYINRKYIIKNSKKKIVKKQVKK
jgi:hypothetical protein